MARAKSLAVVEPGPAPYERSYRRIECNLERYKGYWCEYWTNFPLIIALRIDQAGNDVLKILEVFKTYPIIGAWNLVDFEGNELPPPTEDAESLLKIPSDLMAWAVGTTAEAPRTGQDDELGNSETR